MQDGEEHQQVADERECEEGGGQHEEEELKEWYNLYCIFFCITETDHVCVQTHANVAKHVIVEHNILKPQIIDGHQHWDEEANGDNHFQPANLQLEVLANEQVLVNGKHRKEEVAHVAGVVEHGAQQRAREQCQPSLHTCKLVGH